MNELVSILIPTYNRVDLIAETLDSALAQTYTNIEIIVSDNASTDNTAEIVAQYVRRDSRVKFFKNDENIGPILNWRAGLEKASGHYVKILWSDDLITPDYLEQTLQLFHQEPNLAFVFTKTLTGNDIKTAAAVFDYFKCTGVYPTVDFVRGVIRKASLPCSPGCALFRADLLKKSLVIENELFGNRYLENGAGPDVLMFLIAATYLPRFGFVGEPLSFFREHNSSITVSSDSTSLSLDYAKAIIWYLYHYENPDQAYRYWLYVFNKRQLYRRSNRGFLKGFLFNDPSVRYFRIKFLPFFVGCFLSRSKRWLYTIKINEKGADSLSVLQ